MLSADLRKVRHGCGWTQWMSALLVNQSFKSIVLYRLTHACRNKYARLVWGGKTVVCHGAFYLDF